MLRPLLFCIVILNLVLCSSCNKEKLKAPTASFLVITNPIVNTTSSQGSGSHKITDIWLYVNGNYQGAYEVGKTMPLPAENTVNISLLAGIKNNGISATRQSYTFYKKIEFSLDVEAGKTYSYSPVFEYKDNLNFPFMESFDSFTVGSTFANTGDTSYLITYNPNQVYGGVGGSLFLGMSSAKPVAKIVSNQAYYLPIYGANVYMEVNYKCNHQVTIGVMGNTSTGDGPERPAITLNPTNEWNKIYIQLSSVVSTEPTYTKYKIYFKALKSPTVDNPEIYLDNIKVIY